MSHDAAESTVQQIIVMCDQSEHLVQWRLGLPEQGSEGRRHIHTSTVYRQVDALQ